MPPHYAPKWGPADVIIGTVPDPVWCSAPSGGPQINTNIFIISICLPFDTVFTHANNMFGLIMKNGCVSANRPLSVSNSDSLFIGPHCAANGWLLSIKQRQAMALHAVAECHICCVRGSPTLYSLLIILDFFWVQTQEM